MRIALIAAVAENAVIGRDNALPWRLPRDLKRFRALTMGHHLLLGRRTYEAIGRPLPGRRLIVLTSRAAELPPGVEGVGSLADALQTARVSGENEAFIGGGEQVYRLALPLADRLYLTRVHASLAGDAHFPNFDPTCWKEIQREHYPVSDDNELPITFIVLDRMS